MLHLFLCVLWHFNFFVVFIFEFFLKLGTQMAKVCVHNEAFFSVMLPGQIWSSWISAVEYDLYVCLLVQINAHHSLVYYLAYSNIQQKYDQVNKTRVQMFIVFT